MTKRKVCQVWAPRSAEASSKEVETTPKGGKPALVFHVHANVPASTTFVTEGVILPGQGQIRHLD